MTAVHLMEKAAGAMELIIINQKETFAKGIAFNPYSRRHLLNVTTARMSAFPDRPDHFLDWVLRQDAFKDKNKALIAHAFLPRYLYGEYLSDIWKAALGTKPEGVQVKVLDAYVTDMDIPEHGVVLSLDTGARIRADKGIIATGNHVPRNPSLPGKAFFSSRHYFRDPWKREAVADTDNSRPVLIIGNGLTMVDTVLGLLEHGFHNVIFSVSPNGFNILPHRHGGMAYPQLAEALSADMSLREIVSLFNKHIKQVREFGLSAEPVVDAIRPFSQAIWQHFSEAEKRTFLARLRHLWGVARHRIPTHIHDLLQQLRVDRQLEVYSGKLLDICETPDRITVHFFNKKSRGTETLEVGRVINCTGPETDLSRMEGSFLKNAFSKGILIQDALKLGIEADPVTFETINKKGEKQPRLFVLGSNLKGVLWESTAVHELREQADRVARHILTAPANKLVFAR